MSQAIEFESLVRACHGELFAVVLARSGNRESAKDLLQEVLLAAWRNRERLLALPDEQRRRYLFAMAKNRAIDAARQAMRRDTNVSSIESVGDPAIVETAPADDRLEMLQCCMTHLPPNDRELLLLSTIGGLESATIADRLGSIPSTVRSRLSRIRRQLRDCITAKLERPSHAG